MHHLVFETNRCTARFFQDTDFDFLHGLHSDPEIMRYIGKGIRSKNEVTSQLQNIIVHQQTYGYSQWVISEKVTGTIIGRAGLLHLGTLIPTEFKTSGNPIELGYTLSKDYWGKGYATEIAKACLNWGFTNIDVQEIVAKTHIDNAASQTVLKKLGMTFQYNIVTEGQKGLYFSVPKNHYMQQTDRTTHATA